MFFKNPASSLLAIPPTEPNFYFSCWRQVLFLKNLESSLLAIPPTEQTFFFPLLRSLFARASSPELSLCFLVSLAHCRVRKYLCPPTRPCLVYLKRAIVPWVHKKIILVFWFLPSCCLASCCVLCAWCLGLGALLWLVFPLFSHGNFMILSVSRVVAQGVCAVDFP